MALVNVAISLVCCMLVATGYAGSSLSENTLAALYGPAAPAILLQRGSGGGLNYARDTSYQNGSVIEQVWENIQLFALDGSRSVAKNSSTTISGGIDVTCLHCYITAQAAFDVDMPNDTVIEEYWQATEDAIEQGFTNLTQSVMDLVDDEENSDYSDASHALDQIENVQLPPPPSIGMSLRLSDLELYAELQTVLSGQVAYTLHLYRSQSVVGVWVGSDVAVGAFLTVDLLLSADADVTINSGFHIKLEDDVTFQLEMFNENVSRLDIGDGHFEFLPVSIVGAGASVKAILRVGASIGLRAGYEHDLPDVNIFNFSASEFDIDFGAGAGLNFYADVAHFEVGITAVGPAGTGDIPGCDVEVTNTYGFAVGAAVGASAYAQGTTWGPVLASSTALVSQYFAPECVHSSTASPTSSASSDSLAARQTDLAAASTTTSTTTAIICRSPGLLDCPLSLQEVITGTVTSIITPSASGASLSSSTSTPLSRRPFNSSAMKKLQAISGVPTAVSSPSFVAEPSSTSPASPSGGISSGHMSQHRRNIIIGVTVGLGVPLLLVAAFGIYWLIACRRAKAINRQREIQEQDRLAVTEVGNAGLENRRREEKSVGVNEASLRSAGSSP